MATTYAIPDGRTVMAATLYTGTGATQTISNAVNGVSMQPDFVWVKGRSGATSHNLSDSVRGTASTLFSNTTGTENTSAQRINAFNSNGFSVGNDTDVSTNAATYVAWQWKASGSTVSNTSGSITSTVSANTAAGFSVVTYTGTGANATVGHGLGVAPSMIFCKNRNSAQDWIVYHTSLGNTKYLGLNTTTAAGTASTVWNNTSPTSTVFSLGSAGQGNGSTNGIVAYCFAAVAGYSAFGSYTGNGSTDGPFVYLGFRPRWILLRDSSAAQNWILTDTTRSTYNSLTNYLLPNTTGTEGALDPSIDILSNGFKMRTLSGGWNTSSSTMVYAAFAENPFKYANAR